MCGALSSDLRPGDVVVASELIGPEGPIALPSASLLEAELRRHGLPVRRGPLMSVERLVTGARRGALEGGRAIAVDMESSWIARGIDAETPLAVVRVVVDTPTRDLRNLPATVAGGLRGLLTLRRVAPVVAAWAAAGAQRRIVLAGPRAACAGVDRAIQIVEDAVAERGAPLYVRRQIVHNSHVVAELEARGAVFVRELAEVPEGASVVLSAHGVAPSVRAEAERRNLEVIDATCPLVAKVHAEAQRFAAEGRTIVVVGDADHEEVEGVLGEAPERMRVVANAADVAALEDVDAGQLAFLTQTTLAVDDADALVSQLRRRFPEIAAPPSADICYATQNRQDAVREIAPECDLLLVVGSRNSANSNRLVEIARRCGTAAHLVEDERDIELEWLARAGAVGVSGGASAPERIVQDVVRALGGVGPVEIVERTVAHERVNFKQPPIITKRKREKV